MKALSIHAPWVFQILTGLKKEEYRTWKLKETPQKILMCASAKKYPGHVCGQAIAILEISNIEQFQDGDETWYAWIIKKCTPIKPFKVKGQQKLFDVPDDLIELCNCKTKQEYFEKYYDPNRSW